MGKIIGIDLGTTNITYSAPGISGVIGCGNSYSKRSCRALVFKRSDIGRVDDAAGMMRIARAELGEFRIGNCNFHWRTVISMKHHPAWP